MPKVRTFYLQKHYLKTKIEPLTSGAVEVGITKLLQWIYIKYLRLTTKVWIWRFRRKLNRMTEA